MWNIKKLIIFFIIFNLFLLSSLHSKLVIIWTQQYNGKYNDISYDIALDKSGNVYITGASTNGANWDYFTISYSNKTGGIRWTNRYDSGNNEWAQGIAVDNSSNVYVTGTKWSGIPKFDYFTIKYTNGNICWSNQYNNGPGNKHDLSFSIDVDNSGYVYVTGASSNGTGFDYCTIKYDAKNGNGIWTNRYDSGANDGAYSIAVDNQGHIYVTGASSNSLNSDYFTISYSNSGTINWTNRYDSGANDVAYSIAVDTNFDCIYATGTTEKGGNLDCLTIKYDPSTETIVWDKKYGTGSRNESAQDITVDRLGYIYIAGWIEKGGNNTNFLILKYDPEKNDPIWAEEYDSGNTDKAYGIAVDSAGYIYVTGTKHNGTDYDYFTIKYLQSPYPNPSSLSATIISNYVKLSWNDTTINESGFKIYRREDGTFFSVIGTTSSNISYFQDTNISEGSKYWYYVIATNKAGQSEPSNIAECEIPGPSTYSIDDIVAGPNPFNPSKGEGDEDEGIIFDNVPSDAVIKIYTLSGSLVITLKGSESSKKVPWKLINQSGKECASGIYICRITDSNGKEKIIKLVIIR